MKTCSTGSKLLPWGPEVVGLNGAVNSPRMSLTRAVAVSSQCYTSSNSAVPGTCMTACGRDPLCGVGELEFQPAGRAGLLFACGQHSECSCPALKCIARKSIAWKRLIYLFAMALMSCGQGQLRGRVRWEIAHPLAEPEQALDRRKGADARDGRQPVPDQRFREALQVAQCDLIQRLRDIGQGRRTSRW